MNILNLFHPKPNKKEIADTKLMFFGKPYDATSPNPHTAGRYRIGRWLDGRLYDIPMVLLSEFNTIILNRWIRN